MEGASYLESILKEKSDEYFQLYTKLKEWAVSIWSDYTDIPEQIRHGVSHIHRVLDYADVFLTTKVRQGLLNEREIFLLLSSIYLHDIGMQTGWKEHLNIKGNRGNLSPEERLLIRKHHAEVTGKVIRSLKGKIPSSLSERLSAREKAIFDDLNESFAFICESHNTREIEQYLTKQVLKRFPQIKLKIALIAAILQFSDALHMDKSRLNEAMFLDSLEKWLQGTPMESAYEPEDWKRFFQCYYVESSALQPVKENIFRVEIRVRFNREESREIIERFLDVYERRLQKSRHDCITVINREADIHFLNDSPFQNEEPDLLKIRLPERLLTLFKEDKNVRHEGIKPSEIKPSPYFMGRDSDISALKKLVKEASGRLVTLHGAPGIGKTGLSLALAEEIKSDFTDGYCFISLEGIRTKDGLVSKINLGLGVSTEAQEELLYNFLTERESLLIFDNFEDPLNDRHNVLMFMHRLIENCRKSRIIITSREPLMDSTIELIHRVDKLDRKDSRRLLEELAKAQDFKEELNQSDMDGLLDELGDVPLAIVLAAPYVRYGIKNLTEYLKTAGIKMLRITGISDEDADKSQSYMKSLSVSYMTISETNSGMLFQVCSLFPAGLYKEDAIEILPQITIHDFITLDSKSLLSVDSRGRYTMLAPIRNFAFEIFRKNQRKSKLEERWLDLVKRKSVDYEDITRGKGRKGIDDLLADLPNIFNALDRLMSKGVQGKNRMLYIIGNMTDFMRFRGLNKDALRYLKQAEKTAKEAGDISGEANCIKGFGKILIKEGRIDQGRKSFDEAEKLYKSINDNYSIAVALYELGSFLKETSKYKKDAVVLLEKAAGIFQSINLHAYADMCRRLIS